MLKKFELLSINQTMAQIKLTKAWKANRDDNYPVQLRRMRETTVETQTRNRRPIMRKEM